MYTGAVTAEHVPGLELPRARAAVSGQRVHGDRVARRQEVRHRPECIAADEDTALGPPQRHLAPARGTRAIVIASNTRPVERHLVVRDAEALGERRAVPGVAIDQLDHSGRLAQRTHALVDAGEGRPRRRARRHRRRIACEQRSRNAGSGAISRATPARHRPAGTILPVSDRLVLGCGNFGGIGSAPELFGHRESEDEAFAIMDAAWAAGIAWFDTADAYGGGRS